MTSRRRFLVLCIVAWGMLVTLLRAIRLPNDYAESHWLVDYRFGFVKRGLVGTAFTALSRSTHLPQAAWSIALLSSLFLAISCGALLWASHRILARLQWSRNSFLLVSVFVTSPFVVMSAHLIGYYDDIVLVLTLLSILLVLRGRFWTAGLLQTFAVLVHEISLLTGLPCVLFGVWMVVRRGPAPRSVWAFTPFTLPLLTFAGLASYLSVLDQTHLQSTLTARLSSFAFIAPDYQVLVPEWLVTSFAEFVRTDRGHFLRRLADPGSLVAVLPSLLVMATFVATHFETRRPARDATWIACVALAPLAMHLLACDTARIWCMAIAGLFWVALVQAELGSPAASGRTEPFRWLAWAALVTNMMVRVPLMDHRLDRFTLVQRLLLYAPLLIGAAIGSPRQP